MVYDLPVAETKIKPHQVTALHLICALAFIGSGAIIFVYNYTITYWGLVLLIFGLGLLVTTIVRNRWLLGRNVNTAFRVVELLIAGALGLLAAINTWKFPMIIFGVLGAAIAFALYWERTATAPSLVHIDDEGVRLPAQGRARFIPWREIDQVVFRYGILTVDCLNNTLYQLNIAGKDADNDVLEAYCYARIEDSKKNRRTDDW